MSVEEDLVLSMELEQKVTNRIRTEVDNCLRGTNQCQRVLPLINGLLDTRQIYMDMVFDIKQILLNDPGFITELTKHIGSKMQNIY